MKFVFTCGGTAGHIYPAVAVAGTLKEKTPDASFLFIGARGMMEEELVPAEGYAIKCIRITNISRERSLEGLKHNAGTVKNVLLATSEARKILKSFSPDAVIGTGGYVCYPVVIAARELGIPCFIHESNAFPGITTKLLSRHAERVMVGMEGCAGKYPDPSRVICTGTPVRGEFCACSKQAAKAELGLDENEALAVSVWGSLGAAHMNEIMLEMIPLLCAEEKPAFKLIHATGKRYYDAFMEKLLAAAPDYKEHGVDVRPYISDMPRVMAAADLVMCRAGASTLAEIAYMGKPSVLVPSPNVAENHQEKNARLIEASGGAKVFLEGKFDAPSLYSFVSQTLCNSSVLDEMAEKMAAIAQKDAAEKICDVILPLIVT